MTAPLVDRVRRRLVADGLTTVPDSSRVAVAVRDEGVLLGDEALLDLVSTLGDELAGLGPLRPLVLDPTVTDVLVNGPADVWVDRGDGLERSTVRFPDSESVTRLAQRLASLSGRRLDEASPYVDARLRDGTRLHAVIPPISRDGALISLRIPHHRGFDLDDFVAMGSLDADGAAWLRAIVDARLAFLVSGGTGSGKTTLLSALLGLVDPRHRILIAEDSAELRPRHPHVVRLEARPANLEGAGQVTLRDLVRQALRMRPDRVVIGEVRGAEVVDLLSAMNTGHEGGCGTVHANSPADVPA
ncbi:MAG: TadA family conjugal transfer-associated ATPase, partial [Candidatus Nanopelagicales bacterium]